MKRNTARNAGVAAGPAAHPASHMGRQALLNVALIAGLLIAGGLCGVVARTWIGGLKKQHAQLERCALDSKHSNPNQDARSTLARLEVEVPVCMSEAGYEKALNNGSCGRALWQGDVFCYVPKSFLGKLIFRIETSSQRKAMEDDGNAQSSRSEG
jgi:hypothetical protein